MATTPHPRSSLRRTACDRCRQSKLRCLRNGDQGKCTRCLRLDLCCSVAPAKPPGRPRKLVPARTGGGNLGTNPRVSSNQFLGSINHNALPRRSSTSPHPSPDNLPPGLDGFPQIDDLSNETPLLSRNESNSFFGSHFMLPFSEHCTPEWNEANYLNAGCSPNRDPLEVHSLFTAKLDRHECLKELSQINVDLHGHWQTVQELNDSGKVNFVTFVAHPPPPAGDGISLAEKLLIMAQRFQQAITNLIWVVKHESKPLYRPGHVVVNDEAATNSPSSYPLSQPLGPEERERHQATQPAPEEDPSAQQADPSTTPFACVLVSCYVQLVRLWETMFFHAHRRAAGLDRYPLALSDPSKGVQLGAFYVYSGRLASMFYCQAALYFLDNIDRGLGIVSPEQQQQQQQRGAAAPASGLLSHPRHLDMLRRELRAGEGGEEEEEEEEEEELGSGGSDGVISKRVKALRDAIERARLSSVHDTGI
ncbi:uncharacterized protein F4812DRAFT_164489 [Daldinia caldariorum]|uniref:uncharacterized protein n=1 Tax=Daldinia caldariorum TaxID=326644 RepID=UPI0020072E69|nr:uncharacterized protein F4812DRAFT_164489 [Daldinia caldariorum]KAI1471040.1 hypothetical protein F4812DRAFT_164489 [Daldinia caldariorum]